MTTAKKRPESLSSVTTRPVPFFGFAERTGPLLWSQKSMWNYLQRIAPNDRHLNQVVNIALPYPVTFERISDALSSILLRHESLRTIYPSASKGEPVQQVCASGEIPLYVYEEGATTSDQPWYAPTLQERFDVASMFPLRVAIKPDGEGFSRIAVCLSHMSTDLYSNQIIREELRALLLSRPLLSEPPAQPIALAAAQQERGAQGKYDHTYAYWRSLMAEAPVPPLEVPLKTPAVPRYWHGMYTSSKLAEASGQMAIQSRVNEAAIVLAAVVRGLARYLANTRLPLWLRFSNRFRREFKGTVGYLCQNVPVLVEVDLTANLVDFARAIETSMMKAYRHAEHDPDFVARFMPGNKHYHAIGYNAIPRANIDMRQAESRFEWVDKFEHDQILLFVNAYVGRGVSMVVDTAILSPEQLESCLRHVEDLLVQGARRIPR